MEPAIKKERLEGAPPVPGEEKIQAARPGGERRYGGAAFRPVPVLLWLAAFLLWPSGLAAAESLEAAWAVAEDFRPRLAAEAQNRAGQVETILEGSSTPTTILADEIEYDEARDLTVFIGRVRMFRGQEALAADRVVWRREAGSAELTGSVRLEAPEFTILAERAAVNLNLRMAKIYRGRAFFPRGHYYVDGEIIERLNEKEFRLEKAEATACDGPAKSWTIQASRLHIAEDGYAAAAGAVFKVNGGSVPLFAAPYFIFPVKTERQTGLLKPAFAVSSSSGATVSLPLFWAADESYDFTYTPVWREKRGLSSTLEGRYHLDWGRGLWQASYLSDHETRLYKPAGDAENKTARRRFWLRGQNQSRFGDWDLNLNMDLASDPLYLREFASDPDGFNRSHAAFLNSFGHSVEEYLNPNRRNELYAQKLTDDAQFRAGIHYTQNLYRDSNTLQRLPSLQYDLIGRELGAFETSNARPRLYMNARYDHFHRRADAWSYTDETGHRIRFNPALEWTRPLGGRFNLKATGDIELAAYAASGSRPGDGYAAPETLRHDGWNSRLSGQAELEISTAFSRIFEGGPGRALAFRHLMTPRLSFSYAQAPEDQGRLPYWDQFDRRPPRRTLRYGLLNALVSKTARAAAENGDPEDYEYFQFLKFNLSSSYELADNGYLTEDRSARYYDVNYYGRGQGPLEAEVEAFFNPRLSARLFSSYVPSSGQVSRHDLSLNLNDDRGDRLTLAYDYGSPEAAFGRDIGGAAGYQEARVNLDLALNSEWSASLFTRFNMKDDQSVESVARLSYQAQCYGLNLIYSKTYGDESLGLMVDLLGLGSVGLNGGGDL